MKRWLNILFIIVGIILLDTIQALVFNNNPVIGTETKCMRKQGIFVDTYHCNNGKNVTMLKKNNGCYYEDVCGVNSSSNEVTNMVIAIIDGEEYTIVLEDNETAKSFVNLLPKELNMNELNGNEKYVYLDNVLPTDSYNPKHIEVGDVMLYGDNCLVIFYKPFDTSYSYTKIGHIDNLVDLGKGNVIVKFENNV